MQQDHTLALDWNAAPRPDGGVLHRDIETRREAATDLGGLVHATPGAVLRPGGERDIAHLLAWASLRGVPTSAGGSRHQMGGQASPGEDGLLIDTRSLTAIDELTDSHITVGAGTTLREISEATAARGLRTTAGSTGYTRLTIGGVASAGGITSAYRTGALIDSIVELELVTATGEIHTCSPEVHSELFEAALAGGGRAGIITRVRLALTHAPSRVRTWSLHYPRNQAAEMLADLRALAALDVLDELWVQSFDDGTVGADTYRLHASVYYTDADPDPGVLWQVLGREPAEETDQAWAEHAVRHDALYDELMTDWAARPKAWSTFFLPERGIEQWLTATTPTLTGGDFTTPLSQELLFPHRRNAFHRTGLALPEATGDDAELVYLWGVLLEAPSHTPRAEWLAPRHQRAQRWAAQAAELGGTVYPIGTWGTCGQPDAGDDVLRDRVDPHHILAPKNGHHPAVPET